MQATQKTCVYRCKRCGTVFEESYNEEPRLAIEHECENTETNNETPFIERLGIGNLIGYNYYVMPKVTYCTSKEDQGSDVPS